MKNSSTSQDGLPGAEKRKQGEGKNESYGTTYRGGVQASDLNQARNAQLNDGRRNRGADIIRDQILDEEASDLGSRGYPETAIGADEDRTLNAGWRGFTPEETTEQETGLHLKMGTENDLEESIDPYENRYGDNTSKASGLRDEESLYRAGGQNQRDADEDERSKPYTANASEQESR